MFIQFINLTLRCNIYTKNMNNYLTDSLPYGLYSPYEWQYNEMFIDKFGTFWKTHSLVDSHGGVNFDPKDSPMYYSYP